jgi:hypothetical protein
MSEKLLRLIVDIFGAAILYPGQWNFPQTTHILDEGTKVSIYIVFSVAKARLCVRVIADLYNAKMVEGRDSARTHLNAGS